MVEVSNLSFAYSYNKLVFEGISFNVESGSIVSILGPSGIGKSTLALLLLGLREPLTGHILVADSSPNGARIASRLSYAPQRDALLPWLSVKQNLKIVDPSISESKIEMALTLLGMADSRDTYPSQLSGGMRTRVNLARALMRDSALTVLDEPIAGLDEKNKQMVLERIVSSRQDSAGVTILIIHDVWAAALLSDHYIVFSNVSGRASLQMWQNELVARRGRLISDGADISQEELRLRRILGGQLS